MSQQLTTTFVSTNIPGAYPNTTVISQPVGLGNSGIVVIYGEAAGGPSYEQVALKTSVYSPSQLALVTQIYTSGQIVDAFTALAAPSDDPDITGTANQIYICKTNTGTMAHATVPTDYGTLTFNNYGVAGNFYQFQVTEIQPEVTPTVTGGTIPSFAALDPGGTSFTIRYDGGAGTVVTLPSGTYTTGAQVAAALTGLPSEITATGNATSITLTVNTDPDANTEGYGKSFELIDSTPGDLAALGLLAGLSVSADEPGIEVSVTQPAIGFSETLDVSPDIALNIGYQGTTGTLTITSTTLTTTVTGGSGASLTIPLSQFTTIGTLAAYISNQTGYTALANPADQNLPPSALDQVSAVGIASTGVGLMPGRIKDSIETFESVLSTSPVVTFTATATAGLPTVMAAPLLLSGGTRGPTLAIDIINVLEQLAGIQCNFVVPLFSEDASSDIILGVTDPASTYTIAAINAATKNHCIQYSTPLLKKFRSCILSYLNSYGNCATEAQSLSNYRCSLTMQQVKQVNSSGVITTFQPWYASCLAAGMQTGGFYKSICNKAANVVSYIDPPGFDSGNPGDVSDALYAGLLFFSQDTGRAAYWVSDQTTYSYDSNFVYNSIQAVYTSDLVQLDLAESFFLNIVGQSDADIDAGAGLSLLSQKMAGYKQLKLIAASSDAPLGWKNGVVSINGPTMTVAVEIKLATAIYFVPISISISQVMNTATST
jgi:hypothetical protein